MGQDCSGNTLAWSSSCPNISEPWSHFIKCFIQNSKWSFSGVELGRLRAWSSWTPALASKWKQRHLSWFLGLQWIMCDDRWTSKSCASMSEKRRWGASRRTCCPDQSHFSGLWPGQVCFHHFYAYHLLHMGPDSRTSHQRTLDSLEQSFVLTLQPHPCILEQPVTYSPFISVCSTQLKNA